MGVYNFLKSCLEHKRRTWHMLMICCFELIDGLYFWEAIAWEVSLLNNSDRSSIDIHINPKQLGKQESMGMKPYRSRNLPPQNIPLGPKDCFRLIIFKKEKAQKKLFTCPLTVQKNLDREPLPVKRAIIRDNYKEYEIGKVGVTPGLRNLSLSHHLCVAQQTFI